MFRIFQLDKNSNNNYYLACSGFEIYGDVLHQHPNIIWDQHPKNTSQHLQVDGKRNAVTNTGSENAWKTVKARKPLQFAGITGENEFSLKLHTQKSKFNHKNLHENHKSVP